MGATVQQLVSVSSAAKLVVTPALEGMRGAIREAEKLAEDPSTYMPQQFKNPDNPEIHFRTTGPEIWNDTQGNVDVLVAGVGTGGTITGVSRFFEQDWRLLMPTVEWGGELLDTPVPTHDGHSLAEPTDAEKPESDWYAPPLRDRFDGQ